MKVEIVYRPPGRPAAGHFLGVQRKSPRGIGILPGSFNPPTIAHLELARAAGRHVDEVLCVIPRALPHKPYFGATLEQRVEMLRDAGGAEAAYSIGVSDGGLFAEIAGECRAYYQTAPLYFLCGADAAERILAWDYGRPDALEEMFRQFSLLVAARGEHFHPPPEYRASVHSLHMRGNYHRVSSTEVRERIRRGESWEHLVPAAIVPQVRSIYS